MSFERRGEFQEEIRALPLKGEKDWERIRRERALIGLLEAHDLRSGVCASLRPTLGRRITSWHHLQPPPSRL